MAAREFRTLAHCPNLPIASKDDDAEIRAKYRPFLLKPEVESTDWISELELETAVSMAEADLAKTGSRLKVLVLYGSLRQRYTSCLDKLYLLTDPQILLQAHGLRSRSNLAPSWL